MFHGWRLLTAVAVWWCICAGIALISRLWPDRGGGHGWMLVCYRPSTPPHGAWRGPRAGRSWLCRSEKHAPLSPWENAGCGPETMQPIRRRQGVQETARSRAWDCPPVPVTPLAAAQLYSTHCSWNSIEPNTWAGYQAMLCLFLLYFSGSFYSCKVFFQAQHWTHEQWNTMLQYFRKHI